MNVTIKTNMSKGRSVPCIFLLIAYFVFDGVDSSVDTTTMPGTNASIQNNNMTSTQQIGVLGTSESEGDVFLEPKNCTRIKMTTVTVNETFQDKCQSQRLTCSGVWFWKKCRDKVTYRACPKYRTKTKVMATHELICCKGLVPYNDTAAYCVKGCETGKYGENCTLNCNCTGNTRPDCELITGNCKCMDGWTGQNCTDVCDDGFYGHNCENTCACENNSTCDPVNGTCNCTVPGWIGDLCDTECPEGQFGYYCNQNCSCPVNATCDPHTGECKCMAGLTGINCTEVCGAGYFGADCQQTCTCLANSTRACDPVSGTCECKAGWTGRNCGEYCGSGTYGELCRNTCNCTHSEACNPINGECISRFLCSVNGTSNCDPVFGVSDCTDIERNTSLGILHGTIRDILNNPKDICDSATNQSVFCVPGNDTVFCECLPGWTGYSCERSCSSWMYGPDCRYKCSCDNGNGCDRVDGRCLDAGKGKEAKTSQDTPIVGTVLGIGIPIIIVICLVVACVVCKRKGLHMFGKLQVTVKKTRSTSQGSFANNHTYELPQRETIGSTSRESAVPEDRYNANGDSNDESTRERKSQEKSTVPSKDLYSRVVKTKDSSYDCFQNNQDSGGVGDMYSGPVVDDVYNELNHRNGRHSESAVMQDDEYSHVKHSAFTDDSTNGDSMYVNTRSSSNTYDAFQEKGTSNAIADYTYDTNASIAAGSAGNTNLESFPN